MMIASTWTVRRCSLKQILSGPSQPQSDDLTMISLSLNLRHIWSISMPVGSRD